MTLPIPSTLEDIDATWMSSALDASYPGIRVSDLEVLEVINGSAAKIRFAVTTDVPSAPNSILVKTAFTEGLGDDDLARSWLSVMALLNDTECRFYREVSAKLGDRCAACYHTSSADIDSVIVMEDLSQREGIRFSTFDNPLSPDDMASVLEALAALHALRWDDADLRARPLRDSTLAGGFLEGFLSETNWEQQMARPRAKRVPDELNDYAVATGAIRKAWAHKRLGPQSYIHGDPHVGNFFFDEKGGGLFDFQLFTSGHWASDVVYAMGSSMEVETRRRHEEDLLKHYLDQIRSRTGVAPAWNSAWFDYRKFAIWGFVAVLTPGDGIQSEEYNTVVAERQAIAALDHDSIALLQKAF